jgi:hypothetical protein
MGKRRHRYVVLAPNYSQAQEEHEGHEGRILSMKSALVMKGRKSKKSAHMQGMRHSGDERLWRDELTLLLLHRSNSRFSSAHSTLRKPDRTLFFAHILFNVGTNFYKSLYRPTRVPPDTQPFYLSLGQHEVLRTILERAFWVLTS